MPRLDEPGPPLSALETVGIIWGWMLMQVSGCYRPMLIAVRGIHPGKRDPVQPPCGRCSGVGVRLQVSGPYEILPATVEIVPGSVHVEALGRCHRVHATACRGVPSCPLIAFNSCMVLGPTSPPEHPPPPGPLYALLRLYRSGVGLRPTLLLDRLRLHLLIPLFLPDLLQQLPPRITDPEHRAVNVIVIRSSLPFVGQLLSLLLALQQIVLHLPPHRAVAADPIESSLLRVSPARGERSVHPSRRAGHPSFRMVGAECH